MLDRVDCTKLPATIGAELMAIHANCQCESVLMVYFSLSFHIFFLFSFDSFVVVVVNVFFFSWPHKLLADLMQAYFSRNLQGFEMLAGILFSSSSSTRLSAAHCCGAYSHYGVSGILFSSIDE